MAAEAMMMNRTPGDMSGYSGYEVRGIEPYGSFRYQPVETPFPQTTMSLQEENCVYDF
jgi:hypothetical protein